MPSCVVKSCKNYMSKHKKSQGITYHTFPRNKNRRDDWISIIRNCRGENNWNPSTGSTVCSAHFEEKDFMTTAKGLRCLVPYAFPKRLLSNSPETQTHRTFSPVVQVSQNARGMANDHQPTSSSSTISSLQEPVIKDEFNLSGYCRLCATSFCDGTLVNVESDNVLKELVVNMSNRLNTNIDFSEEHLPTTVCSVCIKSLYMSYDFVVGIDLAQNTLYKILMQKHNHQPVNLKQVTNVDLSNTSVKQENNSSEEACDLDKPGIHVSSGTTSSQQLSSNIEEAPDSVELKRHKKRYLKDTLHKKKLIIDLQKKNIKRLNQKVRRFRNRNESLKNILKNLKEQINTSPDLYNIVNENIVAAELFKLK